MIWRVAIAAFFTTALSLFALNTHAQVGQIPSWPPVQPATSVSYVGPQDAIGSAPTAFWSCARAVSNAFAATQGNICELYGINTTTTCNLTVGTNGLANLSALSCVGNTVSVTTFCTVTNASGCIIAEMYDQTSNGYGATPTSLTVIAAPVIAFNVQNGLPCAYSAGTEIHLQTSESFSLSSPYTFTVVGERATNDTTQQFFIVDFGNTHNVQTYTSANTWRALFGTAVNNTPGTGTDGAMNGVVAVSSSGSPDFAVYNTANGTNNLTSSLGTTALSAQMYLMGNGGISAIDTGYFCEGAVWPAAISYATMITNMRSSSSGYNF